MKRPLLSLKSMSPILPTKDYILKFILFLLLFSSFSIFSQTIVLNELKAFPTAEGYGKNATGGRGGTIIEVTNLNDSGVGSWRAAFGTAGPRIIIPKVSGTVNFLSEVIILDGDITVMGQAAPAGGTTFRNWGFKVRDSNMIFRNFRIRIAGGGGTGSDRDGFLVNSNTANSQIENIILDHISISGATDENFSISAHNTAATTWTRNITMQNCISSESNKGWLIGGNNKNLQHLSFLNNYTAHVSQRCPDITNGGIYIDEVAEVVNTLVYSYDYGLANYLGGEFDIRNNYIKDNPNDAPDNSKTFTGFNVAASINSDQANTKAYINGNIETPVVRGIHPNIIPYLVNAVNCNSGYVPYPASEVPTRILPHVGASLSGRDSEDDRVVLDFTNGTGAIDPSTYENSTIPQNTGYVDANNDGIDDEWATTHEITSNTQVKATYIIGSYTIQNNAGYNALDIFMAYMAGDFDRLAGTPTIEATGVTVSPSTATINIPETITLTASFQPTNATDQSGTWSSSNTDIATVNASGEITPINEGEVIITFNSNSGGFSDSATITVTNMPIEVESVSLSPETLDLNINTTTTLAVTILPANATDVSGTWTSSDNAIATVDQNGLIQPLAIGETTITFTTSNGLFGSSVVTVNNNSYGQYEFYNADSDNLIEVIEGGEIFDLEDIGENVNFRIIPSGGDTNPDVESVGIQWVGIEDGNYGESAPIYAGMNQHFGNDYQPYTVIEGTYNFTVTYYSEDGQNGDVVAVDNFSLNFIRGSQVNAGDDRAICLGETTVLTATAAESYLWSTGETTASISVTPDNTTEYTVTGTHSNGTLNTTDSVIVVVNQIPTVSAGEDLTICEGESIILTATVNIGSIVWSNGATTESITVSPSETSTYTVTANNNGCLVTDEITVNVVASPIADAGNNITLVIGDSATLTATGGGEYLWSTGETTNSIVVSPAIDTNYTVTVSNDSGCTSEDTVSVTVVEAIIANAGNDVSICNGESTTLTATGGDNYEWSTGETTQSITVNPNITTDYTVIVSNQSTSDTDSVTVTVLEQPTAGISNDVTILIGESTMLTASGGGNYEWSTGETTDNINVTPDVTTTYTVIVSNVNGCNDTASVTVTVLEPVVANAGEDVAICEGDSVTLTANGGDSYLWNTGETTQSITINPLNTTTYSVTVSNQFSSDTDEVLVTVNPIPIVNAGEDVTINEGESVTLYASGGNTYVWSTGDTNANISVSPTETTTYSVTTTINGCSDTDEVTVTVIQLVNASAGDDQTICLGESITLTATGGETYEWSTGENTQTISVSPDSTMDYTVTVFNANGSDSDDVRVNVEQCGPEDFEFKTFPNPSNGLVNVKVSGLNSDVVIQVVDILGNQLKYIDVEANAGQTTRLTVDLRGMAPGMYLITLYGDNRTVTRKLILR